MSVKEDAAGGENGGEGLVEPLSLDTKLVQVLPGKLVFNVPNEDTKDQVKVVTVKSFARGIAFKVQSTKRKFYIVSPCKGTMVAEQLKEVKFETTPELTPEELKANTKPHKFVVTVVAWEEGKDFDDTRFKEIEAEKKDVEVYTIDVDHIVKHLPTTFKKVKLLDVKPIKVTYKEPFGKDIKIASVTLKHIKGEPVAFKLSSNKPEFYDLNFADGIIQPKKSLKIEMALRKKFGKEQVKKAEKDAHKFQLIAMPWPKDKTAFDDVLYNKRLKEMEDRQVTVINVKFEEKKEEVEAAAAPAPPPPAAPAKFGTPDFVGWGPDGKFYPPKPT